MYGYKPPKKLNTHTHTQSVVSCETVRFRIPTSLEGIGFPHSKTCLPFLKFLNKNEVYLGRVGKQKVLYVYCCALIS